MIITLPIKDIVNAMTRKEFMAVDTFMNKNRRKISTINTKCKKN